MTNETLTVADYKFDVLAVSLDRNHAVRILDRNRTAEDAKASMHMAVLRRGVETEFFAVVPAGSYADGQKWSGVE